MSAAGRFLMWKAVAKAENHNKAKRIMSELNLGCELKEINPSSEILESINTSCYLD
jgi:hypothetical protein